MEQHVPAVELRAVSCTGYYAGVALERRIIITFSIVVLIVCLMSAAVYAASNHLLGGEEKGPTITPAQTATRPPTHAPTPISTPKPASGVTSINFTRWHPSGGENTIIIAYPTENAVLEGDNLSLKIYAASKSVNWAINSIYYTADWLGNDTHHAFSAVNLFTDNIEVTINFHDIPDGYHTFTAYLSVHDYSKANVTVHFTTKTV